VDDASDVASCADSTAHSHLRGCFGPSRAIDVTTDRNRYIAHRQSEKAAHATIQQELSHLKRAFNLAVQAGGSLRDRTFLAFA
jgi:hypothetical protein